MGEFIWVFVSESESGWLPRNTKVQKGDLLNYSANINISSGIIISDTIILCTAKGKTERSKYHICIHRESQAPSSNKAWSKILCDKINPLCTLMTYLPKSPKSCPSASAPYSLPTAHWHCITPKKAPSSRTILPTSSLHFSEKRLPPTHFPWYLSSLAIIKLSQHQYHNGSREGKAQTDH